MLDALLEGAHNGLDAFDAHRCLLRHVSLLARGTQLRRHSQNINLGMYSTLLRMTAELRTAMERG